MVWLATYNSVLVSIKRSFQFQKNLHNWACSSSGLKAPEWHHKKGPSLASHVLVLLFQPSDCPDWDFTCWRNDPKTLVSWRNDKLWQWNKWRNKDDFLKPFHIWICFPPVRNRGPNSLGSCSKNKPMEQLETGMTTQAEHGICSFWRCDKTIATQHGQKLPNIQEVPNHVWPMLFRRQNHQKGTTAIWSQPVIWKKRWSQLNLQFWGCLYCFLIVVAQQIVSILHHSPFIACAFHGWMYTLQPSHCWTSRWGIDFGNRCLCKFLSKCSLLSLQPTASVAATEVKTTNYCSI